MLQQKSKQCFNAYETFLHAALSLRNEVQQVRREACTALLRDNKEFRETALSLNSLRTLPKMQGLADATVRKLLEVADVVDRKEVTPADAFPVVDKFLREFTSKTVVIIDSWAIW